MLALWIVFKILLPWEWGVPIVVWLSMVGLVVGYLGVYMALHPPADQENGRKWFYKISFVTSGMAIIGLTWRQNYADGKEKESQFVASSNQVAKIEREFRAYRTVHEQPIPSQPDIKIMTLLGLPPGTDQNPYLRYHQLQIQNMNEVQLENFCARLQFPEPISATVATNLVRGASIGWKPILTRYAITGSGTRSQIDPAAAVNFLYDPPCMIPRGNSAQLTGFSEGGDLTGVWEMTIDRMAPHSTASISFLTSTEGDATNYISLANTQFTTNGATVTSIASVSTNGSVAIHQLKIAFILHTNTVVDPKIDWRLGTNELRFSFEGDYQFPAAGKPGTQHFLVPLRFDPHIRKVSSLPIRPDDGHWRRVVVEFQ